MKYVITIITVIGFLLATPTVLAEAQKSNCQCNWDLIVAEFICAPGFHMKYHPNGLCKRCEVDEKEGPCFRTGCSGEVCADHDVGTICVMQPWYVCLALTECTLQPDNECGWTETEEFLQCVDEKSDGGGSIPI